MIVGGAEPPSAFRYLAPQLSLTWLWNTCWQMLFEVAAKHSAEDALVLTLGGDHSIGIGSVAGASPRNPVHEKLKLKFSSL